MNEEALRKMIYLPKTAFDGERGHVWLTKLFNKILSAKAMSGNDCQMQKEQHGPFCKNSGLQICVNYGENKF